MAAEGKGWVCNGVRAANSRWSIYPRALPWTQMARLIGPLSLNCTYWNDEAQRGAEMSLRPHNKTGRRQNWKLTPQLPFIHPVWTSPVLGAANTTVSRRVHSLLDQYRKETIKG